MHNLLGGGVCLFVEMKILKFMLWSYPKDIGTIAHQAIAAVILVENDLKKNIRIEQVEIGSMKTLIVKKYSHTEEHLARPIQLFPPIIQQSMMSSDQRKRLT